MSRRHYLASLVFGPGGPRHGNSRIKITYYYQCQIKITIAALTAMKISKKLVGFFIANVCSALALRIFEETWRFLAWKLLQLYTFEKKNCFWSWATSAGYIQKFLKICPNCKNGVKSQNGGCRVSEVAQLQKIFWGKTLSMCYYVCQMLW